MDRARPSHLLRSLAAAAVMCVAAAGPARGAEWMDVEGALDRVSDAVFELRREARTVWSDARSVEMRAAIRRLEDGQPLQVRVDEVFVTRQGIVDGSWVARGDDLPQVTLRRREQAVANGQRREWERDFGVLRKFDWTHLCGDWLDVCGLPRPDMLSAGEEIALQLEAMRRIPVLVLRYSTGDAACRIDDLGTTHPYLEQLRDAEEAGGTAEVTP